MKKFYFPVLLVLWCLLLFPVCLQAQAPGVLWAQRAGGVNPEFLLGGDRTGDTGKDVEVDRQGNVYVTGSFSGKASFGATMLTSRGQADIFLAKYDAGGKLLWVAQAGGKENDYGREVSVDRSGNIYVAGYFHGTATFGTAQLTSAGRSDAFLAKFEPSGKLLWARQAGGESYDDAEALAMDPAGNVYLAGSFEGHAAFDTTRLTSPAGKDQAFPRTAFLARYDAAGQMQWVKALGGSGSSSAWAIATDKQSQVFITGIFDGQIVIGAATLTSRGSSDVFVARFDAAGKALWARQAGGTENDNGYGLGTDGQGNVYVCGIFGGKAIFGTTTLSSSDYSNMFVAKYTGSGKLQWALSPGGKNDSHANSLAVDGAGNAYLTGAYEGQAVFGTTTLGSSGNREVFVAKYNALGKAQWALKAKGTATGEGIHVDEQGQVYVTGRFSQLVFFGGTPLKSVPGVNNTIPPDVFVMKLGGRP